MINNNLSVWLKKSQKSTKTSFGLVFVSINMHKRGIGNIFGYRGDNLNVL